MNFGNSLINKSTKKNLEIFVSAPFSCLALIGVAGSGKTHIAELLAGSLLDKQSQLTGITQLDAKKSGIEEVRELQKELKLKVNSAKDISRVIIISNFDSYGVEAQNALLKTLEEPPLDTIIIITINKEENVLETIYSRAKKIYINPISEFEIPDWIYRKYASEQIKKAYSLSMGQPGLMVNLLENSEDHQLVKVIELAKEILALPKSQQLAKIDVIIKSKDDNFAQDFCDGLIRIFKAMHNGVLKQANLSAIRSSSKRLKLALECQENIASGLNKKLSLTRLFINL
jgi:DNA polymerase-3 subunit delta'